MYSVSHEYATLRIFSKLKNLLTLYDIMLCHINSFCATYRNTGNGHCTTFEIFVKFQNFVSCIITLLLCVNDLEENNHLF